MKMVSKAGVLLLFATVMIAVAVACGGDDEEVAPAAKAPAAKPAPTATAVPAKPSAPEVKTVKIGLLSQRLGR